jgi:DNA-directed RNA polymerase, mitochondrial
MTVATAPLLSGDNLLAKQIELETEAVQGGVRRYRENMEAAIARGEGASLKPVERLMLHWYKSYRLHIRAKQRQLRLKPDGELYANMLLSLPADKLAVIAMHETLSQCVKYPDGVNRRQLCYAIGMAVDAEINLDKLKEKDGADAKRLLNSARRMSPQRVNAWARHKLDDFAINKGIRTACGNWLLLTLVEHATVAPHHEEFQLGITLVGNKKARRVVLSNRAWEIISDGHNTRSLMRPRYLPMVVPPYPWQEKGNVPGGYIKIRGPLISKPTPEQTDALAASDKTEFFKCLTHASSSAWKINQRILPVMWALWDQGGGDIGLPTKDNSPLPPYPVDGDKAAVKAWKKEAHATHTANRRRKADRVNFLDKLTLADEFKDYDAFYSPHQCCFRSRAYPIPLHLNHQGDDVCRGLLEIAHAKPATSDAAKRWVLIHAANTYGFDKLPFDEREEWTRSVESNIRAVVADPLSTVGWWGEADKPWQFLGACHAVVDPEAAAHLPIQADGKCNGLQHYAAMLRDEQAARLVSLYPGDAPDDVYTDVTAATQQLVAADAAAGNPIAQRLVDIVDRGVCKQTVMTRLAYGVTMVGAREQLKARLLEKGVVGQELYDCKNYLQKLVFDGLGTLCHNVTEAMEWIRECAGIIAKEGSVVRWTTPLGFPVVQPYRRAKRVRIKSGDTQVNMYVSGGAVRVQRQRMAAAPNFVHSVDATHMFMTARRMAEAGHWFAAVHDSYWTHAASADAMHSMLRQEFVSLHQKPLLTDLREQWVARYGLDDKLPAAPKTGVFTLETILTSPYFFG